MVRTPKLPPVLVLLLFLANCSAALGDDPVHIGKEQAVISRIYFDPEHLPTPAPPIPPGQKADTQWHFRSPIYFHFDHRQTTEEATGYVVNLRITTVDLTLKLSIDIWLPDNAKPKLKEHEEGHRKICEHIYDYAERPAYDAAKSVIGESFTGHGQSQELAQQAALNEASAIINKRYNAETVNLVNRISEKYDEITKHGANEIDSDAGVTEAERITPHTSTP